MARSLLVIPFSWLVWCAHTLLVFEQISVRSDNIQHCFDISILMARASHAAGAAASIGCWYIGKERQEALLKVPRVMQLIERKQMNRF